MHPLPAQDLPLCEASTRTAPRAAPIARTHPTQQAIMHPAGLRHHHHRAAAAVSGGGSISQHHAAQRRLLARPGTPRRAAVRCEAASQRHVVVTREAGKNGKLVSALAGHGISCIELPLIEHAAGPDRDKLPAALQAGGFDWVAVTSPEAATVFLEGWRAAGSPELRLAVVGGGTGEVLEAAGVKPAFTATKALGKVMGAELPHLPGGTDTVLYPASTKASTDLQDSLAAAGFKVQRINTYATVGVTQVDQQALQQALAADIVTFGSPSAVKAWVALVGLEAAQQKLAVCIGSTSARACATAGLTRVLFPDSPSIDSWVQCVLDGLQQLEQQQQQPVGSAV